MTTEGIPTLAMPVLLTCPLCDAPALRSSLDLAAGTCDCPECGTVRPRVAAPVSGVTPESPALAREQGKTLAWSCDASGDRFMVGRRFPLGLSIVLLVLCAGAILMPRDDEPRSWAFTLTTVTVFAVVAALRAFFGGRLTLDRTHVTWQHGAFLHQRQSAPLDHVNAIRIETVKDEESVRHFVHVEIAPDHVATLGSFSERDWAALVQERMTEAIFVLRAPQVVRGYRSPYRQAG